MTTETLHPSGSSPRWVLVAPDNQRYLHVDPQGNPWIIGDIDLATRFSSARIAHETATKLGGAYLTMHAVRL